MAKLNKNAAYPIRSPGNPVSLGDDREQYPEIRLESKDELGLPDSGTLVIEFKKTHEQVSNKGKENEIYSCTLEVHKLLEVKGSLSKPSTRDTGTESALDKLAQARHEENEEEGE